MFIVDCRARPPIRMFGESAIYSAPAIRGGRTKRGYKYDAEVNYKDLSATMDQMKNAGVKHAVVPGRAANPVVGGGNPQSLVELRENHPGYITSLAGIDADNINDASAIIAHAIEKGHKGIVVESGHGTKQLYVDDLSIYPIYEAAQAAGLVAYIMGGGWCGPDVAYADPIHIDRVAANFPQLKIVAVHGGFPYVQEISGVMFRRDNVWILPDSYFPGLPGEADYLLLAKTFGEDRFLFGTSYPFVPFREHIQRYLDLPLSPSTIEKILGGNAKGLFSIES